MTEMTCNWAGREDVFEGYVRDALSADERDAFEEHYFSCAACFDRLRTYRALQAELREADAAGARAPAVAASRPWRWVLLPAAVGLALVAVVTVWRWGATPGAPDGVGGAGSGQPVAQAVPPPAAPAAAAPAAPAAGAAPASRAPASEDQPSRPSAPVVALSVLARVDPPVYIPVVLRGPRDEAVERFEAAMTRYVEGDYAGTIPGLRAAMKIDPSSAQISFFLAACQLLTGELEPAAAGFERTIALGESPYLEEAHFYLAKTRLRQGRMPAAQEQLKQTVARHGRLEQEARRLLQQLGAPSSDKDRPPGK